MSDQPTSAQDDQPDTPAHNTPDTPDTPTEGGSGFKADAKVSMVKVAVRAQIGGPGMSIGGVVIPWPNPQKAISEAGTAGRGANVLETVLPRVMALAGGSAARGRAVVMLPGRCKTMPFCGLPTTAGRQELDERIGQNFQAYLDYYAQVESSVEAYSAGEWQKAAQKTRAAGLKAGVPGYDR